MFHRAGDLGLRLHVATESQWQLSVTRKFDRGSAGLRRWLLGYGWSHISSSSPNHARDNQSTTQPPGRTDVGFAVQTHALTESVAPHRVQFVPMGVHAMMCLLCAHFSSLRRKPGATSRWEVCQIRSVTRRASSRAWADPLCHRPSGALVLA